MYKIDDKYCKTCEKCQLKKSSHKLKAGVDVIENGNKYIVAAIDDFVVNDKFLQVHESLMRFLINLRLKLLN
ncbi:hypothetical protein B4U80_01518 [Leptotrombidium deliense]|uniref:Uncharacterized protein n=1 Tax=Leptotrombidium deliense TaxID=299467 RepID=A0A443RUG7_9ACAR|nr:hypothetical protein B4U80_01518 [Leptotrombidium deliense]